MAYSWGFHFHLPDHLTLSTSSLVAYVSSLGKWLLQCFANFSYSIICPLSTDLEAFPIHPKYRSFPGICKYFLRIHHLPFQPPWGIFWAEHLSFAKAVFFSWLTSVCFICPQSPTGQILDLRGPSQSRRLPSLFEVYRQICHWSDLSFSTP